MIISVRSIHKAKNYESEAAAMMAAMSALQYSLKTCVIQLADSSMASVEEILIGKRYPDIDLKSTMINNSGIDAMIRYQGITRLTPERFNLCVSPILKTVNLLDVVQASAIDTFVMDIADKSEQINEILTVAESIYNNVFIVLDSKDKGLVKTVDDVLKRHKHRDVICMSQGSSIDMESYRAENYYLIQEYDTRSEFSLKYYKRLYDIKNIYPLPYNVSFRDSFLSGNALFFLRKNLVTDNPELKAARKEDANAYFIVQVTEFIRKILGISSKEDSADDIRWEHKTNKRRVRTGKFLAADNIRISEKGTIKKKKIITIEDKKEEHRPMFHFVWDVKPRTFERLEAVAGMHKRSIASELNFLVNAYVDNINNADGKRKAFKKMVPVSFDNKRNVVRKR